MKAEIIGIKEETPDTKTFTVNPESKINFLSRSSLICINYIIAKKSPNGDF